MWERVHLTSLPTCVLHQLWTCLVAKYQKTCHGQQHDIEERPIWLWGCEQESQCWHDAWNDQCKPLGRTLFPFIRAKWASLETAVQNIDQRFKNLKIVSWQRCILIGKHSVWGTLLFWAWCVVVKIKHVHKGKAPELGCDDVWLHLHGMQEHGTGTGCDYTYVALNDTLLLMCTNTAKQLLLVTCIKMIIKSLSCKDPIVTVDVLHADIVAFCKHFKIFFWFKGGLDCCFFWQCACKYLE